MSKTRLKRNRKEIEWPTPPYLQTSWGKEEIQEFSARGLLVGQKVGRREYPVVSHARDHSAAIKINALNL